MLILCRQVHEMNGEQQRSFLQRLPETSDVKALWIWSSLQPGKANSGSLDLRLSRLELKFLHCKTDLRRRE